MGHILKLNDKDYLLTEKDGEIICSGTHFMHKMGLSPTTFIENRINIQLLAPRLMECYKEYF
jgi:hypothetical protein